MRTGLGLALVALLSSLAAPAGEPARLHLDLTLRDGSRLTGTGPDVSLRLRTALGTMQPKLSALSTLRLGEDRETMACRSVGGDVVRGILEGPDLRVRPYGGVEERTVRGRDVVSLRVTRPIRVAGSEDAEWRIAYAKALGWLARSHDGRLVVKNIDPAVVNAASHGPWSRVKLSRSFRPRDDFTAVAGFSWDAEGGGARAVHNVYVTLRDEAGREVVCVGHHDAWSGTTGSRYACVGGEACESGHGTQPATGRARLEITRRDGRVEVLWNGEAFRTGRATGRVASAEVSLEFYAFRTPGLETVFGTVTLERIEIR